MYALTNCIIYTTEEILTNHAVVVENDRINSVQPLSSLDPNIKKIDLKGANLCPGFIDLQINGCGGVMFNGDISEQTLEIMQSANLKSGTTSYLPTLITSSNDDMKKALSVARQFMHKKSNEVLGLHLEGPFLSLAKKGIHHAEFVRQPEQEMVDLICASADVVTTITVAPENVSSDVIKQFIKAGINVSIGHSNATYEQAKLAIDSGATMATHLFNAMSSIVGREPGMLGAIYDHNLYAGIIVDGFHVSYPNIRISKRLLGDKLMLVTDATAPVNADIDQFDFVGTSVYYKEGKCIGKDGTLGGSALTMIDAIKNSVHHVGLELAEAVRMATLYPARAIAVDHKLGSIGLGKIANLTVFNDNYKVTATIVNGVLLYQSS